MATRIRLARAGSKKTPFYRMVVTDIRSPRDGNFIEKLGTYNPLLKDDDASRFVFEKERVEYWLNTGAAPSERAAILLFDQGFKNVEKYLPASYPKSADERAKLRQKRIDEEEAKKAAKQAELEQKAKEEAEAAAAAEAEAKAAAAAAEAPAEEAAPAEQAEAAPEAPAQEQPAEEAPKEA